MVSFVKILLFFYSSNAWAFTAIEVGSKHFLKKSSSYHFSSKKLISSHTNFKKPFIIGLKIGELHFNEGSLTKRLFILNKEQLHFLNRTNFIVKSSPFLSWKIKKEKLLITGKTTPEEFKFFLTLCSRGKLKSVAVLAEHSNATNSKFERSCVSVSRVFNLELAFLNENNLSGSTTGTGVPAELSWFLSSKLKFNQITGSINNRNQKSSLKGHAFFSAVLEKNEPLVFESGIETLIRPSGVFSRQKHEWKKITSNIQINILEIAGEFLKTEFKINNTRRSAVSHTHNIEKFEKLHNLKLNQWTKMFIFKEDSSESAKNKIFNLSLLGKRSKRKGLNNKQVWVKISEHD